MSFAQYEYLPFLALVLAVFQFVPTRLRTAFLLVASFAFYLWWKPWHGIVLGASIAVDYLAGLALDATAARGRRRLVLAAALAGNLGLLVVFKYGAFVVDNLNVVLAAAGLGELPRPTLDLPLGLSFYTFQGLGYVIDVFGGRVAACRDPLRFALYVSFFPQLVAGPIERAQHLLPQLGALQPLRIVNVWEGTRLVLWGLAKKLVLADRLHALTWPVFSQPEQHGSLTLAVAMFCMNMVLYLDFSAYTDIARGSARLFGVELVENFQRPFTARSLGEFARRWHVSLYTWIRDYTFLPLARGRLGYWMIWRNSLVVMGLFGLWHGASWSFVAWGLASGVTIAAQSSIRLARTRAGVRHAVRTSWGARDYAGWALTLCAGSLFFVLFFSPDLAFGLRYYGRMFGLHPSEGAVLRTFVAPATTFLVLGLAVHASGERIDWAGVWQRAGTGLRLGWLVVLAAAVVLLRATEVLPFVYFQF